MQTIEADVENVKPQTGDQYNGGVPAPKNMPVTLTFDLARIGLPVTGNYTIERINKDDGTFAQETVAAANGKVQVTVPQGAHALKISAGGVPPLSKVVTLRQGLDGYAGAQDAYLSEWEPDTNMAARQSLSLRIDRYHPNHTGVLRFDLSGLPAGAKVRFAALSLGMTGYANNILPLKVDALARPWKVGEATWNRADNGAVWTEQGASNVPADRKGAISDTRLIYPSSTIADRYGFNVTDIVAGWVANPASNFGMTVRVTLLEGAFGSAKDGFAVGASEYATASRRPQLSIVYTTDEYTPTPTNTATPTDTSTPTPTPTATPPVGPISGRVFLDDNHNGLQDAGEAGVTGRLVQLKRDGAVRDNVTTGDDGRYNFPSVELGAWQVLLSAPPNYGITTVGGNPANAVLDGSNRVAVDFGLAYGFAPSPTPTPTRTPCPSCRYGFLPLILRGSD